MTRSGALSPTARFVAASAALFLVFVSAGTAIPLYNTYRAQDGLTNADLSVVTVVYLAAAAVSLLVLGRLSDHLGRRLVAVAALVSSAAGLAVLLGVHGVEQLATGRRLQGLVGHRPGLQRAGRVRHRRRAAAPALAGGGGD